MNSLKRILGAFLSMLLPVVTYAQLADSVLSNKQVVNTNLTPVVNSYTFKQLGWDSATTLNGYKPDATLYLPFPKHIDIQKISLHLVVAFSPKLSTESRVDINFNQSLVTSLALPADSNKETTIDVELPVTQLSEDWQALNFSAYLEANKNLCSPDLWVYISPDSKLTVNSIKKPFNGTLNKLPSPFIESAAIFPVSNQLLLTSTPTLQEIFALLKIAFKLGEKVKDAKVNLSSQVLSNTENLQASNLILIGTLPHIFARAPSEFKNLIQNDEIKPYLRQDNGILLLNQSPFNPFNGLLIVSGSNDNALDKATQALFTDEFDTLASGKLAIVNEIESKPTKNQDNWVYHATLSEIGYSNMSVSGLGRHSLVYSLPFPNDKVPDYATIRTFITAPIFTKHGLSQITLLVNGQKQASYWLKEDHSAWNTEIEPNVMKPGVNQLEYLIDLHFEDNGYERCSRANYDEVWATVYAQTEINVSFSKEFPLATINQLSVPFAKELVAILPEELTNDDINLYTQFFFKLGQLFQLSSLPMDIRGANQVTEKFIHEHNVIILGTEDTNPWIGYAFSYMPVELKANSRYLKLSRKKLQVSGEPINGILELMPSPWNKDHAVLIVAGNNQKGLSNTIDVFTNDKVRSKLDGNIVLINADQTVETLKSFDNTYLSPFHRLMINISNFCKNIYYYLRYYPQIFIYIFVFIIPIIIVRRNWKK